MDIRQLTPDYAVSPQIEPDDIPEIVAAGYKTLIDNRPDVEIPFEVQSSAMRIAAEVAGIRFITNPVVGGAMTMSNVTQQAEAIASSEGPVLAYCASGNRSSRVWALANAGRCSADELLAAAAAHGYQLEDLRGIIEKLAQQQQQQQQ